MKRFHVSVAVSDLQRSIRFYSNLFDVEPVVRKDDYAKWMLEDPRINFSISTGGRSRGIDHVGLQVDDLTELQALQERLQLADEQTFDQPQAECCYAKSSKTWVRDPDNVAWETFVTHGELTHYGNDLAPQPDNEPVEAATRCCS